MGMVAARTSRPTLLRATAIVNAVSGTVTYAYQVKGLEATGVCESGPSGCVEATVWDGGKGSAREGAEAGKLELC